MGRVKCILIGVLIGIMVGLGIALLTNPSIGYRVTLVPMVTGALIGAVIGFLISLRR
jgi:gas vesicle protein